MVSREWSIRSASRPGGVVHATLWPLIALQLLDTIAFGVASLAHARSWQARWLIQAIPLVLLAAPPVIAHRSDHLTVTTALRAGSRGAMVSWEWSNQLTAYLPVDGAR